MRRVVWDGIDILGGKMIHEVAVDIGYAVIFSLVGGIVGIVLVLVASMVVPRLVERLTPDLDEEKELARGNVAVAEYFGRIVAATILGMSIVVAAAVLAGVIAALH
jgi:ABC-type antimicrobial peptide transport system permease subunit